MISTLNAISTSRKAELKFGQVDNSWGKIYKQVDQQPLGGT